MFEAHVVSAAGTTYCMNSDFIERHIAEAGFSPWRRNVHYGPDSELPRPAMHG